ncbi:MAG: NTP transferase domain-containing protein [Candidatus Limnocylindrales bacterium]
MEPRRIGAVVLAAGASERFGGVKALARLRGRPLLQRVLDAVTASGLDPAVVVLGRAADQIEAGIAWRGERIVRNPDPEAGLSSSLRAGMAALGDEVDAALVLLADQPLVRTDVIGALVAALEAGGRPVIVPRYAAGGGPNPVLLARPAWPLVAEASADRGLGPVLQAHPGLVRTVPVQGSNPDVDTRADLLALDWGERVRENREQVDRVREVPDGPDFYAPQAARFVDDPRRTGDDVLELLRSLAAPKETWLEIGAGAGRYALALALHVRTMIALDPSPAMLGALRTSAREHGISNIRTVEARWPVDPRDGLSALAADVAMIANVGHDVEPIGPFLDAMEAAAGRCVAVLMDRQPAAAAEPFWPPIHGEARVPLPALPELIELLRARGAAPVVTSFARPLRPFPDVDALLDYLRGQLWLAPGSEKDRRLRDLVRADLVPRAGGVGLRSELPMHVGVARWPGAAHGHAST